MADPPLHAPCTLYPTLSQCRCDDPNRHGLRVRRVLAKPGTGVSAPTDAITVIGINPGAKEHNQVAALAQIAIVRGSACMKVLFFNVETPLGSPHQPA